MKNLLHILALLVCIFTSPLLLAQKHSHQKAHVHGEGKMNVVREGQNIRIEFIVPVESILGFEHKPKTPEQIKKLEDVDAYFTTKNQMIVKFNESAKCFSSGYYDYPAIFSEENSTSEHLDLTLKYGFKCAYPDKVEQIDVLLFTKFKSLKKLKAQVVSEDQQLAQELTRQKTKLLLGK